MNHYQYHVFFCTNERPEDAPRPCCAAGNAEAMRAHAKARIKELGLDGPGGVRINKAGCMDRCEEGPTVVIYPEGVWYSYASQADVDEIIDEHLRHGRPVKRLQI